MDAQHTPGTVINFVFWPIYWFFSLIHFIVYCIYWNYYYFKYLFAFFEFDLFMFNKYHSSFACCLCMCIHIYIYIHLFINYRWHGIYIYIYVYIRVFFLDWIILSFFFLGFRRPNLITGLFVFCSVAIQLARQLHKNSHRWRCNFFVLSPHS